MEIFKSFIVSIFLASGTLITESRGVTVNRTLTINLTIIPSCTVSANNLPFGQYISGGVLEVNTSMNIVCTNGTGYQVGLSAGSGASATVANRKMTSGANTLNYTLYRDASRTQIWGNTTGSNTLVGTGTGTTQTLNVYGRVFSNQLSPPGTYIDTVTTTVYF